MKKQIVLIVAIIFSSLFSFAQSPNDISTIDVQDTVVFDISQADSGVGYIEFPVYFLSDDIVNALDFSFKYNQTDFTYDTIFKLASYLSVTSNYNSGNQTVYFTSFSITTFANNTPMVKIRFNVSSGKFCTDDLNSVLVYLNGDACSAKITECISDTDTVNAIVAPVNNNESVELFPNPSNGFFQMNFYTNSSESYQLIVSDMNGKVVCHQNGNSNVGENKRNLNLEFLSKGVYLVQVATPSLNFHKKILLQ